MNGVDVSYLPQSEVKLDKILKDEKSQYGIQHQSHGDPFLKCHQKQYRRGQEASKGVG